MCSTVIQKQTLHVLVDMEACIIAPSLRALQYQLKIDGMAAQLIPRPLLGLTFTSTTSSISDSMKVYGAFLWLKTLTWCLVSRRTQIKPFVREEEDCVRATPPDEPNVAQSNQL